MNARAAESKHERFKRLASSRTKTVLKKLDILGNCSNRQAYEYNEEDIEKIFSAISKKLREVRSRFSFPGSNNFKL